MDEKSKLNDELVAEFKQEPDILDMTPLESIKSLVRQALGYDDLTPIDLTKHISVALRSSTGNNAIVEREEGSDIISFYTTGEYPASSLKVSIVSEQDAEGWTGVNLYNDPEYGGFIWWNQQVSDVDLTGGTKTLSDGIISVHPTGSSNRLKAAIASVIAGHKYLETVTVKSDGEHSVGFQNYLFPGSLKTTSATWTVLEDIQTASSTGTPFVQLYSVSNTDYQVKDGSFMFFDLTAMFGEGNEPTVAEFRKLFPKEIYDYNTGEETTVSEVNGDPYTVISITFPTPPGIVYGGELDVITGVLTVTHDEEGTPLEEPVTYQLDPEELSTLVGENNIWADCGPVESITY